MVKSRLCRDLREIHRNHAREPTVLMRAPKVGLLAVQDQTSAQMVTTTHQKILTSTLILDTEVDSGVAARFAAGTHNCAIRVGATRQAIVRSVLPNKIEHPASTDIPIRVGTSSTPTGIDAAGNVGGISGSVTGTGWSPKSLTHCSKLRMASARSVVVSYLRTKISTLTTDMIRGVFGDCSVVTATMALAAFRTRPFFSEGRRSIWRLPEFSSLVHYS